MNHGETWPRRAIAMLAALCLGTAMLVFATPASAHEGEHGPELWPGYFDEYDGKYHYLLYNPEMHHGAGVGGHHGGGPEDDCMQNPPSNQQIRAANDFAVEVAKWIEDYPIFTSHQHASAVLPGMGFELSFELPGLGWIWDLAGRHWISFANSSDGRLADPSAPENVIYLQTDRGYQPVGVMFTKDGSGPGPDFGGCLTMWHIHSEFGALGEALGYMMHTWTYGNPHGPFTDPHCEWFEMRACIDPHPDPLDHPVYPWWQWW